MQNKQLRVLALCSEARRVAAAKIAQRQTMEFIYGIQGYTDNRERKRCVIQGVSREERYSSGGNAREPGIMDGKEEEREERSSIHQSEQKLCVLELTPSWH